MKSPVRSLGIDTERVKRFIFLPSALATGAVVSFSGMIGFIGMIVSTPSARGRGRPSPVVAGLGIGRRNFLMAADTVALTVFVPSEVPVG